MGRWLSIAKVTALEILSEPLSLLLLLSALALAVFAPAFHYHQFGEATRMARDAGFSALFTLGTLFAVCGAIRSFRREIESGTLDMALAHPVSRAGFFFAKALGCVIASCSFFLIVFAVMLTEVYGAWVGGLISERTGDLARVWGPCFAAGIAVILLPLVIAAALNRFARFRFVLSTFVVAFGLSLLLLGMVGFLRLPLLFTYLPVAILIGTYSIMMLALAAGFAVRHRVNVSVTLLVLAIVISLPIVGNYYLTDALTRGGSVSWRYVICALLAALPVFALAGVMIYGKTYDSSRNL